MLDSREEKRGGWREEERKEPKDPTCWPSGLTLREGLPVVESAHELLAVEGGTLLRSGLGRASSAHLHDRERARQPDM